MQFFNNRSVILWLGVLLSTVSFSHAVELPSSVAQPLTQAQIPQESVGIVVQEVPGGQPLLMLNAATPFNPASTMKLVTTHAALDMLGPAYSWKTRAYATGTQVGDVLHGDLIIRGSGDPKLAMERFWLFLRELRARGIRDIRGNLLIDRSVFGPQFHDAAAFDADPQKPYNAGPDAFLLNYRTVRFQFLPDEVAGNVKVVADPPLSGFSVKPPRLSKGPCGDWRMGLQSAVDMDGARFDGPYPASCGERSWYQHAWRIDANRYAGAMFRQMWADLGGTLRGQAMDGIVPPGARMIVETESAPLPDVVRDINKFSNNIMARQLLLTIGAEMLQVPAMPADGVRALKNWLAAKGLDAPGLVIENGAGLSRDERISAESLGKLLTVAYRSPTMPEFMSSLPLTGFDGTMRKRLRQSGVAGHAHIKTGSLRDVRSIAGYVLAASGRRYAVVFLINHPDAGLGQDAQDALLQWVYENG